MRKDRMIVFLLRRRYLLMALALAAALASAVATLLCTTLEISPIPWVISSALTSCWRV